MKLRTAHRRREAVLAFAQIDQFQFGARQIDGRGNNRQARDDRGLDRIGNRRVAEQ